MKIKIGGFEEEIVRMNNEIFKTGDDIERLSVDLKDKKKSAKEIIDLLNTNFTGSIMFIDDDNSEETFNNYELESVRKNYDQIGKQLFIEFKRSRISSEEII